MSKHNNQQRRKEYRVAHPLLEQTCKRCGKVFNCVNRADQTYCSRSCINAGDKNRRRFDGNRERALERDLNECRLCGTTESLVVHHQDGTGEDDTPNHNLDNLLTVCRGCHQRIHRLDFRIINNEIVVVSSPLPKLVGFLPIRFLEEDKVKV